MSALPFASRPPKITMPSAGTFAAASSLALTRSDAGATANSPGRPTNTAYDASAAVSCTGAVMPYAMVLPPASSASTRIGSDELSSGG